MRDDADNAAALEQRIIAAHRAYIEALAALERVRHRATCSACASSALDGESSVHALEDARTRKEACRTAFRDLVDELGYLPQGLSASLPAEDEAVCLAEHALR